jgi:hypothetical protein
MKKNPTKPAEPMFGKGETLFGEATSSPFGKAKPMFGASAASPFAVDLSDDEDQEIAKEVEATEEILSALAIADAREAQRMKDATDTEYWFCMVFRDRYAKEAFLAAASQSDTGMKYVDGHAIAATLKIDLPEKKSLPGVKTPNKRWAAIALDK